MSKLGTLGVNGLMQVPYQIFLHDIIKLKAFVVFRLHYILILANSAKLNVRLKKKALARNSYICILQFHQQMKKQQIK